MRGRRIVVFGIVAAFGCLGLTRAAPAAQPSLAVRLVDGRQFQGELDPSSNAERLVLTTAAEGITLRRPIRWERITRAVLDGQEIDVEQLRGSIPPAAVQSPRARRITLRPIIASLKSSQSAIRPPAPQVGPVTTVTFYPYVANWDADVETDGLMVELAPVDADGSLTPVSGTLEVELYAPHRRIALDLAPQSGGDTIELVERWTRSVTAADFTPAGLRLRLPFGAVHPEIDPHWAAWWYGIVHVKFSIPGQGVFEDSRDGVRIRPWAPTRDNLELKTGQRFLPTEGLGRRE